MKSWRPVHPATPLTIFRRSGDTWAEEARLLPPDDNERFIGRTGLAIDGDRLAVTAFVLREPDLSADITLSFGEPRSYSNICTLFVGMVYKQVDNSLTEDEGLKTDVWCNVVLHPRSSVRICKVISEWL